MNPRDKRTEELVTALAERIDKLCRQARVRLHVVNTNGSPMTYRVGRAILAHEILRQMEHARRDGFEIASNLATIHGTAPSYYEATISHYPLTLAPEDWQL